MAECPVSFDTINNGIKNEVINLTIQSGSFDRVSGDVFMPKNDTDYQSVMNGINKMFDSPVLGQSDESVQMTIPSSLVQKYLDVYNRKQAEDKSPLFNQILKEVSDRVKASKLYEQVTSENFKNWFKDSVVTHEGEPSIQFHWSPVENIDTFNLAGIGSHFGTYKAADELNSNKNGGQITMNDHDTGEESIIDIPKETGKFYPVFLSIKNPLTIKDVGQHQVEKYGEAIISALQEKGYDVEEQDAEGLRTMNDNNVNQIINHILEKYGEHDGFVYTNLYEDKGSKSYIAIKQNEIKSLYNLGTYTGGNIYYHLKEENDMVALQNITLNNLGNTIEKYKDGSFLIKNRDKFNDYLAFFDIPSSIFNITDDKGELSVGNIDLFKSTDKKDKIDGIIRFLSDKFEFKNNIEYISPEDFQKQFPNNYEIGMTSAVIGNKIYLFRDHLTNDITAEELLHPFITGLHEKNPLLFNNLLLEAEKEFPALTEDVKRLYVKYPIIVQQRELVTKALAMHFNNYETKEGSKEFKNVVQRVIDWIKKAFNDMLNYFGYKGITESGNIPTSLNFNDLVKLINTTDTYFEKAWDGNFYNLKLTQSTLIPQLVYNAISHDSEKVYKLFSEIPNSLQQLKSRLAVDSSLYNTKQLKDLINNSYKTTQQEGQIKSDIHTIIGVVELMNTLQERVRYIEKNEKDNDIKITEFSNISKTLDTLEPFIKIISDIQNEMNDIVGKVPSLNQFFKLLSTASAAPGFVRGKLLEVTKDPIIDKLVEMNEPLYRKELKILTDEKDEWERKKQLAGNDQNLLRRYSRKISDVNKNIADLPTREYWNKLFQGELKDANFFSNIVEAKINNGNPLISSVAEIINRAINASTRDNLFVRNTQQRALIDLLKNVDVSKRNSEAVFKPITSLTLRVTDVSEDDKGVLIYKTILQRSFLNNYSSYVDEKNIGYIGENGKKEAAIQYYFNKLRESRKENNLEKSDKYLDLLRKAGKDLREWTMANSEGEYLDDVYKMWEILDSELGRDEENNEPITLRNSRNHIYELKELSLNALRDTIEPEVRKQLSDEIQGYNNEIAQIKNEYDNETGELKTGLELKLSQTAQQYDKLRFIYGTYVLTDEGKQAFKFDMETLDIDYKQRIINDGKDLKKIKLTKNWYDDERSKLVQEKISPDYYTLIKKISAEAAEALGEILKIDDLSKNLNPDMKRIIKEGFTKIRTEANPYRDEDRIIDGAYLYRTNPELAKRIKEIQEAIESIQTHSQKIAKLSTVEIAEMEKLTKNEDRTEQEQARLDELRVKHQANEDLYNKYKEVIDNYRNIISQYIGITTSDRTKYYTVEQDRVKNELMKNSDVQKVVKETMETGSITDLQGNVWERVGEEWKRVEENGKHSIEGYDDVIIKRLIEAVEANKRFQDTDWYKDNHYMKFTYTNGKYEQTEEPTYIWMQQRPGNENFIENDVASNKYHTYQIKDGVNDKENYINPNYKLVSQGLGAPKAGKYQNEEYKKLSTATDAKSKAYLKYLEITRQQYINSQNHIPEEKRQFDIMPSMIKTHTENTVLMTNELVGHPVKFINDMWSKMGQFFSNPSEEDEAFSLGASLKNNRAIPIRFNSKMDYSKQSADVPAMILSFDLMAKRWNELNKELPIIETIQRLVKEIKFKNVNIIQNSLKNTGLGSSFIGGKNESNLSHGIDSLINMFVYGQTTKESYLTLYGRRYDINKAVNSFLGFTSKAIFIGGIFLGFKNSIATRLELLKQNNIAQGFYGPSDVAIAHVQLAKFLGDFRGDYTKFGNKSFIGQLLDYFQVDPGGLLHHIHEKTNYNVGADKINILTGPKIFSEFEVQVLQFLTIANANKVEVNGKMVPMIEAFELVDDNGRIVKKGGDVRIKKGAKFGKSDIDSFNGLFRKLTREIAGAYRETEKTEFETHWLGKATMYMTKYLASGLTARYAGRRWSIEQQTITMGFHNMSIKALRDLIRDYSFNFKEWKGELSPKQRAALSKSIYELSFILTLALIISLMGGGGGPDDNKKLKDNSGLYNFLLAEIIASKTETETFIPWWGMGLNDLVRKAKSPMVAMQQVTNLAKLVELAAYTAIDNDYAFYQNNTVLHDKGDSKAFAMLLKIYGYTGKTFNPTELIKTQQMLQKFR